MRFRWSKASPGRLKSLACAGIVVALAFLFMGESLLPGKMLAPLDILMTLPPWSKTGQSLPRAYNSLSSDKVLYYLPMKSLIVQAWHAGIPLWEPHVLSGYPIIGDAEAQIFYPGTLPYFFLSGPDASDLVALLHLIVAGLGMLAYLRALGLRHIAAVFGAIAFMFNTTALVWLMWDSTIGPIAWLPWTLWAFETALRPKRFWLSAIGALTVALTYLGGQLQWSLYMMLALALYSVFRFVFPQNVPRRKIVLAASVIGVMGTTLAAIQLLPTLEYISLGHRGHKSLDVLTRGLDWSGFLTLWVPKFYGDAVVDYWGAFNYNEYVVYAGVAPLLLALIAVARRVETKVGFFAGLGLFAAACAAGTDAYRLLSWLPGFDSLTPIRMRYLVAFSVVVLSAFGLEWILRYNAVRRTRSIASPMIIVIILGLAYIVARPSKMPDELARLTYLHFQELILALLLVFSTGLLGLAIVSTRWKGAAAAGICVLTLADLWFAGANYQRPISTSYYYPSTPGVEFMRKDSGLYRVLTTRRSHFDWQFKPNLPAMFGLNDVDGFDSVYLRRYVEFLQQIDLTGPPFPQTIDLGPSQFASPLVDLLNVKYAVSPDDVNAPGWQRVYDADLRVYQRTQPLPHVWIASQAQVMTDDAAILGTLARPDFDPRQTVIIEQTPAEPLGDATNVTAGDVSVTSYENNRLELMAQLSRPGWLVLSEIYYPGWLATIDGGPANLYQADYILRAVPVPAGQHRIILTFMPRSFVIGLLVSLASLMILAALALVTRRRTSSAPSKTTPA